MDREEDMMKQGGRRRPKETRKGRKRKELHRIILLRGKLRWIKI